MIYEWCCDCKFQRLIKDSNERLMWVCVKVGNEQYLTEVETSGTCEEFEPEEEPDEEGDD